jgi:sugar/nucleoside kinase (ribokinase family)
VVGVGANSIDLVYRLPAYPQPHGPDAKQRIRQHWVSPGGQMATALATCRSFGLSTCYAGLIGADDHGRRMRAELEARGIDIDASVIDGGTNQYAVILLDQRSGERIVLWDREDRSPENPMPLPIAAIATARWLHVDDVDQDAAIRAARMAREAGVPVTSDIDRLGDGTEELITAVSIPILAEHVLPAVTGETDAERGLRKLRARHAGTLVVTLGSRGAMMLDGDQVFHEPAFTVNTVDTTGSGDVFRGGFIYARLAGYPSSEQLRFANAAAAVSCTRAGAMNGVPTMAEVERLLRD